MAAEHTAKYVDDQIVLLKNSGIPLAEAAWKAAKLCIGFPYIFGDRGQYCTPAHRRAAYNARGAEHPTIKSKCKNFDGNGTCSGCQFYPGGKTRAYDCRGFTYWILKAVYGWELMGAGATSQWSTASNWKAKGTIAEGMPKDTLCCLFVADGKKMSHTGFGLNNETVECSSGVQYSKTRNKKWTHWAVPKVIDGEVPTPEPDPDEKPTLKKGSSGKWVTALQTMLVNKGYDIGNYGIDGKFGNCTLKAVKEFQKDHGLSVTGVVNQATWDALEQQGTNLYTVTIPHVTKFKAEALVKDYAGATMTEERG